MEERLVRAGVTTVKELVTASPELCSSSLCYKDITNGSSKSEPSKLDGRHHNSYQGEDLSRHLLGRGRNGFLSNHGIESVQLQRKSIKVLKIGNFPSKRPQITQLEDSISPAELDSLKDMPDKVGSYLTKCSSADKTQLAKQKTKFTSKRGDKRNQKLPVKTKNDSFSVKAGLASFSSAAGGNNFFGVHGLKSDNHDVTKHVDDLPLNELLDGAFKHLSLGKDKGKRLANVNDSFLHSVRKACSILQLPRSVPAEVDSHSEMKMSSLPLSTTAVVANGFNGDKGELSVTDLSSCNKVHDSCSRPDSPANPLDMPLSQPNYILERLELPPHKDLESLLLDATKPGLVSKSTSDSCSGRQMSRRASLPPFPWSNSSSWHCRSNLDAGKMPTSRGTCQGRWLRIERNTVTSLEIAASKFTDLESMTYDQSLVPSSKLIVASSSDKISPTISVLPQCELDSSAPATCLKETFAALGLEGNLNHSRNSNDECCSNILAAAQTLSGMATNPFIRSPDGILRWPKKTSPKAMKARKLKSVEKTIDVYGSSIAVSGSDNHTKRSIDRMLMLPPKRPKLCSSDDRKDYNSYNSVRKEPISWSTPRSSRSLPSKSGKESIGSIRHSTSDVVKHSYMMPPPSRVPEKPSHKREKLRKLLTMDWNRGRDRPD
ncbi:uncharacterized protein LOC126793616 [Argentina anserina]|uniref:uncharacterized protein LOC126793616 n=1 Tax=Argentina anserina TaxID=57926 RepID=UPI0021763C30|nr:uncharacterized protein LOC126793616 [Potentilla anserina]